MTSLGHSLVGDTVYGQVPKGANPQLRFFQRQALHAAFLGFIHPRSGKFLSFEVPLPKDMADLKEMLEKNYKV
jgi:23S rRNA pseudouridine1911/1915/1917 synthase